MMKRSKAGSEQVKGRRPKAPEPKRRNVPKTAPRPHSPRAAGKTEVARLTRELSEERRQRTATSEVLHLLSGSHGDLSRLFNTILTNATTLCRAHFGTLFLCEGDAFRVVAQHNAPPAYAELRQREPLVRARPLLRMVETKQFVQMVDVRDYVASNPTDKDAAAFVKVSGVRTVISVPMLQEGEMVGAIAIYRQEVRTFRDREIEIIKNFAAQAVIAIENARLLNELRQRTTDLTEALEQQTATAEVLQAISSSAGDLEPIFAIMLRKAVSICDAKFGTLYFREDDRLRLIATHGVPPAFAEAQGQAPFHPVSDGMLAAVMRTGRTVHLTDLAHARSYIERDPRMVEAVEIGGIRSVVGVPLIKDNELIGLIGIYRQEVRPLPPSRSRS